MRNSSTFSVFFWIYSQREKDGKAPLYMRISLNKTKLNISLKRKADVNTWDPKLQRLKGSDAYSLELNEFLDQEYSRLFQYYQELRIEGRVRSLENLKKKYFGEQEELYSMEDIIDYHNSVCFASLTIATHKTYWTTQKYIRKFIEKEYRRKDYYLKELDYDFIIRFENYLRKVKPRHYQPNLNHNAVMKHIQRLKKMISIAVRIGWIDNNPFLNFKSTLVPRERIYLSAEELEKIESKELESDRLIRVRDLFIFSCYTGISYGDLVLLRKENLNLGINGKLWIVTRRMKNGNSVKIPLLNRAINILEHYKFYPKCISEGTLLPNISNQKLNKYLKELACICGINSHLTFHLARHTFATTVALSNGLPIETVSKILGHKKLSTTQIYAKVVERKLADDMDMLQDRINEIEDGGRFRIKPCEM